MPWSDWADGQTDLGFHCLYVPKDTFLHGIAQQGLVFQKLTKVLANMTLKFLSWNMANTLIFFAEKYE